MLWITGAVLPLSVQLPFWAAALGLELIGTHARLSRARGSGRVKIASWDVSGPHIAERTALFVLIALGEGLLVTGFAFVAMESSPEGIVAMIAAFVAAASAWWIYFDHGERIGSEAIEAADEAGPAGAHRVHLGPPRDHRRHRAAERRRQGGPRAIRTRTASPPPSSRSADRCCS